MKCHHVKCPSVRATEKSIIRSVIVLVFIGYNFIFDLFLEGIGAIPRVSRGHVYLNFDIGRRKISIRILKLTPLIKLVQSIRG